MHMLCVFIVSYQHDPWKRGTPTKYRYSPLVSAGVGNILPVTDYNFKLLTNATMICVVDAVLGSIITSLVVSRAYSSSSNTREHPFLPICSDPFIAVFSRVGIAQDCRCTTCILNRRT